MKKRVISTLLLLCMLITAIPVVQAAEGEEVTPKQETVYDLEKLYVTDGLVAHFSVLGENGDTVSLMDGTWRDLVTGRVATLGNKQYWVTRADGAVGFDIIYGQLQAGGSIVEAKSTDTPLATDRYATNALDTYAKTRLELGIDLLPKDDFTVEYVAKYNPVYVGTAEGTVAKNAYGDPVEYYTVAKHGLQNANLAGACDALGFFSSWATERDGTYGTVMTKRGSTFWMLSENLPTKWEEGDAWIGYDTTGAGGLRGDFHQKDKARSYAIVRDETPEEKDGGRVVKAVYSLWLDGESFKKSLTVSTANTAAGRVYYDHDDTGEFYLSSQTPTDFYGVRVYSRLLTEDEMRQNRLVDLLLYYGIEITEDLFADMDRMENVYNRIENEGFVPDAARKEAIRAEMQAYLDNISVEKDYVSLYTAQENLKYLFTTFDTESVDLDAGTWKSQNANAFATLGAGAKYITRWRKNAFGGIGFNVFCGQMTNMVGYSATSSGNNYNDYDAKLLFGIELLPESDFTVEYLAMYKPLYVYDPSAADGVARNENGVPYETYDYDKGTDTVKQHTGTPFDQLGWFSSYGLGLDGVGRDDIWKATRGSLHWFFNCPTFYYNPTNQENYNHNKNFLRHKPAITAAERGLNKVNDPWRVNDLIGVYAIMLDETLTIAEPAEGETEGKRTTTGLFSLWREGELYCSNAGGLNSTDNVSEYGDAGYYLYKDIDTPCDNASFFLSATQPTDFFIVRIYDKPLTEEEMAHNRGVDMLYYYGAEFSDDLKDAPETLALIVAACADLNFEKDAAKMAANKASLEAILDANIACTVTLSVRGAEYETHRLFGNRITLPESLLGERVLAWRNTANGELYPTKKEIVIEDGFNLEAVSISLPVLEKDPTAATVVDGNTTYVGVGYAAEISAKDYNSLVNLYGEASLRFGLLIAPAEYVKRAGSFTREALRTMVDESTSVSRAAYVEIKVNALEKRDDNTYVIAGTLYDFKDPTVKHDPLFAVIGFIEVDTDRDGDADIVHYGNYVPMLNTTVSKTMQRGKAGASGEMLTYIDSLLSRFGA